MNAYSRKPVQLPKPVDVNRALEEAVLKLSSIGDDFALIGGVALGFYGIERFTKDVDLAVTVQQAGKAETALADCDPRPVKLGGLSISTSTGVRVDLIDHRFAFRALFEEAIREAKRSGPIAATDGAQVVVTPLPYLVAMKLVADRPQDEVDLQLMLKKSELDYAATRDIVHRHVGLYAARRLDKMARAAQRADAPPDYDNGDS